MKTTKRKIDPIRSATMRAVRSKNTKPELTVRAAIRALGLRYQLHSKILPGSPDIVFPALKKAIFVHGCFWHGHDCARSARQPKTNADYWIAKIERNRLRDSDARRNLRKIGWKSLIIWECAIKDSDKLKSILAKFLAS